LGERQRAIVWADFVKVTSYSAISDYIGTILARAAIRWRVKLAIGATGVGWVFSDFLAEKQIEHAAITITAGAATSRKGRYHNVAKNVLLGDLVNGLKTKKVIVAHDLPLRDRFMAELESFEVKTTAAGNTVLDARATEHHADLAVAAIALYISNIGGGFTGEATIAGYWG